MSEKYFNREEAEKLLPLIGNWLEEAWAMKKKFEGIDEELRQVASRIMLLGGSLPPYTESAEKRAERERCAREFQDTVSKIHETGCLVKDLDIGLVDFPCLRGGEEVYLCWKLGEERIGFWHGIHEGFAARKLLDDPAPNEPPGKPRVQ